MIVDDKFAHPRRERIWIPRLLSGSSTFRITGRFCVLNTCNTLVSWACAGEERVSVKGAVVKVEGLGITRAETGPSSGLTPVWP
jgi:hypothetical protein